MTKTLKKGSSNVQLSPAFVANLNRGAGARFLPAKALVNSPEAAGQVRLYMPAIRDAMIMQLGNKDGLAIRSIETRLRIDADAAVKKTLKDMTGKPVI